MTSQREAQLAEFALGLLPDAERDALERELGESAEARAELRSTVAALEALSLEAEPIAPSPGLEARILASTQPGPGRFEGFVERLTQLFDLSPGRVREHLRAIEQVPDGGSGSGDWEPGPVAGVFLYHLDGGPSLATADCGFVYHAPGVHFPRHGHTAAERALVLSGGARTDTGDRWAPGSYREASSEDVHSYRVDDGAPLVSAVVLTGPLTTEDAS